MHGLLEMQCIRNYFNKCASQLSHASGRIFVFPSFGTQTLENVKASRGESVCYCPDNFYFTCSKLSREGKQELCDSHA